MRLPVVSGKELLKFFSKHEFKVIRQRGSHISVYKKTEKGHCIVVIPDKKEVNKKTLRSIIRQAKLTREEFLELWERR